MFADLRTKYDWVLAPVEYQSVDLLVLAFKKAVVDRAWEKHQELIRRKSTSIQVLSADDFLK